jgi:hypothetical protein
LLIIFCISFTGCYSSKFYLADELPTEAHKDIVKIVRLSKITGVMLKDKSVVTFNSKNGEFDENKSLVSGYDITGEYKEYSEEDINYVILKPTDIGQSSFVFKAYIEKRKTKIDSTMNIKDFKSPYWDVMSFGKNKLQINTNDKYIEGVTIKGSNVKIPFEDITIVETNKNKNKNGGRFSNFNEKDAHRLIRLGASIASIIFILKEGF